MSERQPGLTDSGDHPDPATLTGTELAPVESVPLPDHRTIEAPPPGGGPALEFVGAVVTKEIEVALDLDKHYYPIKVRKQGDDGNWATVVDHYECSHAGLHLMAAKAGITVDPWPEQVDVRAGYARYAAEVNILLAHGYRHRFRVYRTVDARLDYESAVREKLLTRAKGGAYAYQRQLDELPRDAGWREMEAIIPIVERLKLVQDRDTTIQHLDAIAASKAMNRGLRLALYGMGAPLQVTPEEAKLPIVAHLQISRERLPTEATEAAMDALFGPESDRAESQSLQRHDAAADQSDRSPVPSETSPGTPDSSAPTTDAPGADTPPPATKRAAGGRACAAQATSPEQGPSTQPVGAPSPPPGEPSPGPGDGPPAAANCEWPECGRALTEKEVSWCRGHQTELGNLDLCFQHQKDYKAQSNQPSEQQ